MNVAFFLIPKQEVAFVFQHWTMRQVMEKMEYHRYSAVPLLNKNGHYLGTITEGDLLWKMKNTGNLDFQHTNVVSLQDVPLHSKYEAISVSSEIEEIVSTLLEQNFVPVVDDSGVFIGIIRRREVIQWLSKQNCNAMLQETD